jgi:hypothetical protein
MMSPITDTLNHSIEECELTYNKLESEASKASTIMEIIKYF